MDNQVHDSQLPEEGENEAREKTPLPAEKESTGEEASPEQAESETIKSEPLPEAPETVPAQIRNTASYPPRAGAGGGAYSAYYNRPGADGRYAPPAYSYGTPVQQTTGGYYPASYSQQNRAYGGPAYGQQPYGAPAEYAAPQEGNTPGKEKKKKNRTGLVVLCCVLGALLLFGGGFAGMVAYNIYYGNRYVESAEAPGKEGSSTEEEDVARDDVTLEIAPTPEISGDTKEDDGLSIEAIAEKVTPSVVGVIAESSTSLTQGSSGSGIIMSEDGYVITNYHVIEGSDRITVVLDNGDDYTAKIVGSDEKTDIAVLKVEAKDLPVAEFGNSDELKRGALAVAIGNPMGMTLQGTVTQGCISAINRDVAIENRTMTLIQTDAAINPGNSGGPLINKYGQVIGINSIKLGIYGKYEGLGFAIPINTVKPIVDELIAYGYIKGRPAIGIMGQNINERVANYYGVPQGVQVESVTEGSDAQVQGVRPGDIIVAVNGERITTMTELTTIRDQFKAGDSITLTVYRMQNSSSRGENIDITIKLMDEATMNS